MSKAMLARYTTVCPLCGLWLFRRQPMLRLPVPMVPQNDTLMARVWRSKKPCGFGHVWCVKQLLASSNSSKGSWLD